MAEHDSRWATIRSIAAKIGCKAKSLCTLVGQPERDVGCRQGPRGVEREREIREFRRGDEILCNMFAQAPRAEFDQRRR